MLRGCFACSVSGCMKIVAHLCVSVIDHIQVKCHHVLGVRARIDTHVCLTVCVSVGLSPFVRDFVCVFV